MRRKNCFAFSQRQDFHCQETLGDICPYFFGLLHYFRDDSKSIIEFRNTLSKKLIHNTLPKEYKYS
jgi:hypothetical protein